MPSSLLTVRLVASHISVSSRHATRYALTPILSRNFSLSRITFAASASHKTANTKTAPETNATATKSTKRLVKKSKVEEGGNLEKKIKAKKEVKSVKIRAARDAVPFKKPGSPYFLYYSKFLADRSNTTDKGFSAPEAAKAAAENWKVFSENEKQSFYDQYEAAKIEYAKAREDYLRTVDPIALEEINKRRVALGKRKIRALPENRKPVSAFFRYMAEERRNVPSLSGPDALQRNREFAKSCGEKWQTMSDAERKVYIDKANEKMEEYRASQ
ncbi:hypothetical protein DFH11DRAFT_1732630 [Phellopilus nigrolimitatus]|nr:hypothetical protein DFH11DRAFT_1732630 [Phellopilus nigrolimitatus]